MQARTYVIVVLAVAAALCGAVIALNARVDPYALASVPDRTNLVPDAPRPGVFWRKVLDIYATSVDYDPSDEASKRFFQTVQKFASI